MLTYETIGTVVFVAIMAVAVAFIIAGMKRDFRKGKGKEGNEDDSR